jgi:hypothetical protein
MAQTDQQSISLPKKHTPTSCQHSLNTKDGLKEYGNKGEEAILKEVKQLQTWQALIQ